MRDEGLSKTQLARYKKNMRIGDHYTLPLIIHQSKNGILLDMKLVAKYPNFAQFRTRKGSETSFRYEELLITNARPNGHNDWW